MMYTITYINNYRYVHTHGLVHIYFPLLSLKGFHHSTVGKESACNAEVLGSVAGLGRSSP